jgi:hypothetical protein
MDNWSTTGISKFFVSGDNEVHTCPICGGQLRYRDSRLRIMRVYGGTKHHVRIRRLRCMTCGRLHNELPRQLTPYKHYATQVIEDVISERVDSDDDRTIDGPSPQSMKRWRKWYRMNLARIKGLIQLAIRKASDPDTLPNHGDLLPGWFKARCKKWLQRAQLIIYNSGGFLVPIQPSPP